MTNKPQFVGERICLNQVILSLPASKTVIKKNAATEYADGLYPAFSASGQDVWLPDYRYDCRGIVVSAVGARCGKAFKASGKWNVVANTHPLALDEEKIDWDYAWRLLNNENWWIKSGSGQPFVKVRESLKRSIYLPPLSVQKQFATNLKGVENQIAIAKQSLADLDSIVKSRFVEMFENGKTDTVRLGDWCEKITKGTTPTTAGYSFIDDGINFIKVETLSDSGDFIPDKLAHISCECHAALKRSQLKEGDLLFSIAGAIGRIAIVTSDVMPANTNQALAIIRLNKNAPFELSFLKQALSSSAVVAVAEKLKRGVAQINLSLKDVGNFLIPCPDMETQRDYSACVSQVDKSRFVALRGERNEFLFYS